MDEAIRDLLDAFEATEAAGADLGDTVMRECLYEVLYEGFVIQRAGYQVPSDLLLNYTEAAAAQNAAMIGAWQKFLQRARAAAAATGLDSQESREKAFLDSEVTTSSGRFTVGSYFD